MNDQSDQVPHKPSVHAEVEDRFGVLPNFFRLAPNAPEITENLWGFAKFAYLDNPLPSLFKERLFVYLSQFCEVRYCIARHVGFLMGLGHPSGDRDSLPETPEQIVRLLQRGFPKGEALEPHVAVLEKQDVPLSELPESESIGEEALFACVTHVFLQTAQANRCLEVLRHVLDEVTLQQLLVFITFVRTAHFWTKVHPELRQESDVTQVLSVHETLAECVLEHPEAANSQTTQTLLTELAELKKEGEEAELLRVTLASIGDAVIATDSQSRVTTLNLVAEQLTGWTHDEAVGQPLDTVFRIVNEQTRQPVENPATRALREGVIVGLANHTLLIAKDGTEHPIDDSAAPIRYREGQVVGCVLVFRDVTERRRLERENAEREKHARFLAAIVTSSEDAIISKTLDGTIQSWNAAAERIFGYTEEQAVGSHISMLIPAERANEEEQILTRLRAGEPVEPFETVRLKSDGQKIPVSLTISPIKDAAGQVIAASKIVRDISERKRAEDERIRLASIVENSSDFIGISDVDGNALFLNRAGRELVGLPKGVDIRSTTLPEFLVPQERESIRPVVLTALSKEGRWSGELTFQHIETGAAIPVWCDLFRVDDPETDEPINFATVTRDLTERKRAEAALRESEQRYRTLFESMDEGFCVIEMIFDQSGQPVDYRFQETNQVFEEQSGLRDVTGKSMRELVPDHDDHWFEIYGKVATSGESIRFCNEAKQLGRWFDVYATRVGGAESRKVAVIFNDITSRKQAEAERERLLREVESERERLIDVFQHAPSFMCVLTGPDHVVERVNDRYDKLVGNRDLVGKPIREALPEIERQGFVELLDEVYRTGEPFVGTDLPVLLQQRPGEAPEERIVDFVYQALRSPDGEVTGILAQGIDLTDRKLAEQQLREHEQRFRMLVEQVEDYAIFMTDTEGRATSWNEGVLRVLGFEEEEFLGQDIIPTIFTPEDVARGVPQAELAEAAATGSSNNDRWMRRKDGTYFWAAGVTTGLHDEAGKLLGFMKVMRDQTERKQIEDELREVAAELSEADRRKTEFLATLGHELRNPLAPIRTGLEAIKLAKHDPAMLEEVRSTMERQVQQMVRLIDDLLDVSRITQGKLELRTCRVAMTDVVQSAVEATRPYIDEAGHELTVTLPEKTIFVDADPNRLAQVFSNLLNNSTKYTPDGGHIWLTVERQDGDVMVTVKDDGVGIPAEMLDEIFEMFTQIDRPLEKGHSGLGIGLTLVKRLVELHNGRIKVQSAGPDQGSEFSVRLPILIESAAIDSVPAEPNSKSTQHRILVVDDNQAAANMLQMVVKMLGNEVRTAYDGEQAIEVAADFLPDVILMDLGMPRMNGYEAAREIRNQSWGKDILLVALTGWGQDEDRERTQEAGFNHHLVKPAEPAAIQQLLQDYQSTSK